MGHSVKLALKNNKGHAKRECHESDSFHHTSLQPLPCGGNNGAKQNVRNGEKDGMDLHEVKA